MKKAVLSTMRVNTQDEIKLLKLRNSVIEQASGITHYLDIEKIVTGGWVTTVWVDDAVVESGEYADKMIRAMPRIEAATNQIIQAINDTHRIIQAEKELNSPQGLAAQDQVKKFFNLG